MSSFRASTVALAVLALACGDAPDAEADAAPADPGTAEMTEPEPEGGEMAPTGADIASTYAPELEVDLSQMTQTETGLYYQDLVVGEGAVAESGQTLSMHYTGWLPDGTKFDSSVDRGEPYSTQIGVGRVIQGWDQGVPGMRVGGKRKLVIPFALAYGEQGRPPVIPPRATLVFDVELLEIIGGPGGG